MIGNQSIHTNREIANNMLDKNYKDFLILEANGNEYRTESMPTQIQHSLVRKYWRNLEFPNF